MEEAIRSAVGDLKPGDVITAEQLAHRLGLEQQTVGMWLDVLSGEGRLIRENRVLSDIRPDSKHVPSYRVPPYG
jgi:DNA-binding transcriptional ArsR family regulator